MVTAQRLRSSADIREVVSLRRAAGGPHVIVHARLRADAEPPRVAVVAGRRVGNAVARNRAKRRLRAILHDAVLPTGTDLVLSAKSGADEAPYPDLVGDVRSGVRRAVKHATDDC
ncbi:hypothetical protein BH23ACT9_BH23ACT9_17750 [soil metagenome]